MNMQLTVNGGTIAIDTDPEKPLLWVLREEIGLTGTKYGCGVAACGACTVHLDGKAVRSCALPVQAAVGREIVTIEAVSGGAKSGEVKSGEAASTGRLAQQAWLEMQVPQCGYCQSGMIMSVAALLAANRNPSDAEIDAAVTNICRCGTYPRIRKAVRAIARRMEAAL